LRLFFLFILFRLLALAVEVLVEAMVQEENLGVVHFAMDLAAKGVILVMVVEE